MPRLLHHPWLRLVLGVLAAGAVGVLAARIAGPTAGRAGAIVAGEQEAGGGGSGGGAPPRSGGGAGSSGETGGGVAVSSGGDGATVHVTGAVRRPGVYELRAGARVQEAVRKAGGATGRADRGGLNLAAEVRDGQQVVMPERVARADAAAGGGSAAGGAEAPVDLNAASPEDLDALEGVGPATAEKIVALREERGGLGGVDDLDEIPGIGPKRLEALRGQLGG